jgi:hypothetical protein
MIADEKVGPRGVKVRCKKCGHIILVKPLPTEESVAAPVPAPPPAPSGEVGLDVELGQAFDAMLGGPKPEASSPSPGELSTTQPVPPDELARLAAGGGAIDSTPPSAPAAAGSGAPGDWYVAVRDQQVGPLTDGEVKDRWEAGEVGPDSLVWRSGMADWKPLSAVPALAEALSPIPRAAARPSAEPPSTASVPVTAPPEPVGDAGWRPSAASALAALANQEMASLSQPQVKNGAPATSKPNGKGSLLESMNLPDSGGVDPTGAIPLQIKGLDSTGESELKRTSSVARSAAEARGRRALSRTIMAVGGGVVAVAAIAGAAVFFSQSFLARPPERPRAVAPPMPAPPPPPVAVAPPPAQPPLAAPAPEAIAQPSPVPTSPAQPPLAQAAPAPSGAANEPAAEASAAKPKRTQPSPAPKPPRKPPQKVAVAERPAPAPVPVQKPKKSSGDPLLDFDGNGDNDLENLGGSGKKRSVYVPPAPGGDLASEVSQAEIQEGVAGKMAGLRDCLGKQEAADPNLHGVLKLRWVIAGDGSVGGVRPQTPEFANQPITKCLSNVVKTIRFPRSKTAGQEVIFPFKF